MKTGITLSSSSTIINQLRSFLSDLSNFKDENTKELVGKTLKLSEALNRLFHLIPSHQIAQTIEFFYPEFSGLESLETSITEFKDIDMIRQLISSTKKAEKVSINSSPKVNKSVIDFAEEELIAPTNLEKKETLSFQVIELLEDFFSKKLFNKSTNILQEILSIPVFKLLDEKEILAFEGLIKNNPKLSKYNGLIAVKPILDNIVNNLLQILSENNLTEEILRDFEQDRVVTEILEPSKKEQLLELLKDEPQLPEIEFIESQLEQALIEYIDYYFEFFENLSYSGSTSLDWIINLVLDYQEQQIRNSTFLDQVLNYFKWRSQKLSHKEAIDRIFYFKGISKSTVLKTLSMQGLELEKDQIEELYQFINNIRFLSNTKLQEIVKYNNNMYFNEIEEQKGNELIKQQVLRQLEQDGIYIDNCGLVFLWPYLQHFFENIGLTKNNEFISDKAKRKAVALSNHLIYPNKELEEHKLVLNKILCGLDIFKAVPIQTKPLEEEINEMEALLNVVIQYWSALKKTSIKGLQDNFLQKQGKLYYKEGQWKLEMERKTIDVLTDKLPWRLSNVKTPFMEKVLHADWM